MPAAQDWQPDAPVAPWYEPAGQSVQAVAAASAEYLPAAQLEQAEAPAAAEYLPEGHAVQLGAPSAEYLPLAQFEHVVAPLAEEVPAGQAAQTADEAAPVEAEYRPPPQAVQADSPGEGPWVPAGQKEHAEAPAGEKVAAAHRAQADEEAAPEAVE